MKYNTRFNIIKTVEYNRTYIKLRPQGSFVNLIFLKSSLTLEELYCAVKILLNLLSRTHSYFYLSYSCRSNFVFIIQDLTLNIYLINLFIYYI